MGLNLNFWTINKFSLALGTYDVIGLASKKQGYGRGANLMLNFKL